jgi:hypothetical protein
VQAFELHPQFEEVHLEEVHLHERATVPVVVQTHDMG